MCLAPIGSIPSPIDIDGLAIGIELDISGIGDLEWLAAAEECPDEQAAATSASNPITAATLMTEPGRQRPRREEVDIGQTSSGARAG